MAINTDLMITIDSGYDEPKYGVSKALSNYTLDEIWNSAYVGANFPVHRMITKSTGEAPRYWNTSITRPYTIGSLIYQWGMCIGARISASGEVDDDEYAEDGIYTKTIWLYSASTIPQTVTDLSSVRMVTQMDFTRFKLKFDRSTGQSTGEGAPTWGDNRSYGTVKSNAYLLDNSDPDNPVWKDSGNITLIKPYQMVKIDDKYCLIDALTTGYYASYLGGFDNDTPKEVVTEFSSIDNSLKFGLLQSLKKTSDSYGEIRWYESSWSVNYPSMYDNYKAYMQNRTTSQGYNQTVVYPTSQDEFQKNIMGYGVYFETDKTYKPIISGGYVTGYTDNLSTESEIDSYTGSSIHVVPDVKPGPPTPSGDDDDYSDMGIGTGGNVGGLTSYAIMNISDLADLIADFNARLEDGQSVVNNFVCCYKLGPLSSFLCTTGSFNIVMSAYSTTGNNFVSTRADYAVISSQKSHILLGTFTVPRMTNTFYDFAPYTTYELFIPCCGWVPLPDSVAGRDIQVYLVFDLASCVCKGICRVDGTTVAEVSGVIGSSVPFYINDSGLARAALVTGVTQTIGNVAMGAVGAMGGNPGLAVMGLVNAVQSAQQTAIAGNTNYIAVRGGNGDMSAYANGEYCTIKITHPVIDQVVETSMFGHSVGYLCEEVGQLSNFHGFTVCANPHVHINATSAERDEITQLLEQGVILP